MSEVPLQGICFRARKKLARVLTALPHTQPLDSAASSPNTPGTSSSKKRATTPAPGTGPPHKRTGPPRDRQEQARPRVCAHPRRGGRPRVGGKPRPFHAHPPRAASCGARAPREGAAQGGRRGRALGSPRSLCCPRRGCGRQGRQTLLRDALQSLRSSASALGRGSSAGGGGGGLHRHVSG